MFKIPRLFLSKPRLNSRFRHKDAKNCFDRRERTILEGGERNRKKQNEMEEDIEGD